MKKQSSLITLGLIFILWFGVASTCSSGKDSSTNENSNDGTLSRTTSIDASQMYGTWQYVQGVSEGKTTDVSGELKLNSDGTFADDRHIGEIGGFRKGTFSVSGDQLKLKDKDGDLQSFTFYLGTTRRENKEFTTLTLKEQGLSYLLVKKEK